LDDGFETPQFDRSLDSNGEDLKSQRNATNKIDIEMPLINRAKTEIMSNESDPEKGIPLPLEGPFKVYKRATGDRQPKQRSQAKMKESIKQFSTITEEQQ
jgi:hypothetical protein